MSVFILVRLKKTRFQKWARNIPLIEDPLTESVFFLCLGGVNLLHPNISINILHTVLYTLQSGQQWEFV